MMPANDISQSVYTEDLYRIPSKATVVLTTPWSELTKEEQDQLVKITQALERIQPKLGFDGITVLYYESLDLSDWKEKPDRLIYFGQPVKGINFYEVIQAENTRMVLSESLADLLTNEGARARLWVALKQLLF